MNPPIPLPDLQHPDMSPNAIDQRLRELSQIYRLGMSLQGAKWIGPLNPSQSRSLPELTDRDNCLEQ